MTAIANRVRARQPRHSATAREHHEDHGGDRHVDGAGRRAEAGMERRRARAAACRRPMTGGASVRHRPGRREPPEGARTQRHRRVRAPPHLVPTRVRPGAARVRPTERSPRVRCSAAGTSKTTRNVPRVVTRQREEDGQETGAPQRVNARRRELMGGARQCLTAANHRQRQGESEHVDQCSIDERPARDSTGGGGRSREPRTAWCRPARA